MRHKIGSTLSLSHNEPRVCQTVEPAWPVQMPSAAPYSTSTSCSPGEEHTVEARLLTVMGLHFGAIWNGTYVCV